jgi:MFS superfamily sulfate permease-like transporter
LISGLNPNGILIGFGATHIFLALAYNLPLPVQPMKAIAALVLSDDLSQNQIYGAGFSMGIVLTLLAFSGRFNELIERIPRGVVKGIQLALATKLAFTGARMVALNPVLAIPFLALALILIKNSLVPSSILLVLSGFIYASATGDLQLSAINFKASLVDLQLFSLDDVFQGFISASLGQLPLTLTNAVVATLSLIRDFFPNRDDITQKSLLANMGVMNLVSPFVGGIPMCHGSGGLLAHYSFGARTGGAIMILGIIELFSGLFLSESIVHLFTSFPRFMLGVMLIIPAIGLARRAVVRTGRRDIFLVGMTAAFAIMYNLSIGMIMGVLLSIAFESKFAMKLGDIVRGVF